MARQFWLEVIILLVVSLVLGSCGSSTDSATKLLDDLVEKIADALAKNDKCKGIKSKLLSGCTISENCLHLTCSTKIVNKDISLKVKLNRCAEPRTVTIDVKVVSANLEWSHVFTSGVEVPVPRLAYSVPSFGKAGLYVKVELTDEDGKLTLQISLVAKAKLGPIKVPDASFKVASPQLPISTEYCGFARWWYDKNTAVRISLAIAFLLVVLFVITGGCFCCCCRCCKPCKRRSNGVV